MRNPFACEFVRLFRLRSLSILGGVGASILAAIGFTEAVIGFAIGLSLFVVKSFFLYEAGRALIKRNSKGMGTAVAGLASMGRILFLAVALALVAQLSHSALFAACGGLFLGQIHLHLGHMMRRKTARCSNT